jgi:hypothetical protein
MVTTIYPLGANDREDVRNVAFAAVVTLAKTVATFEGLIVFSMITTLLRG